MDAISGEVPILKYKSGATELFDRLRAFYMRQADNRIFATMEVPNQSLARFRSEHTEGECVAPDPDERAEFWDRYLAERAAVEDDSLPVAYLSEMDQGLYGGLLGGDVRFMCHPENGWISSMVPPLLDDLDQFDVLRFDRSHPWWQRYIEQMKIFAEKSRGKWGVSHFILIDGLNFVFELIGGTQTYLNLYDRPDWIRRAIDFAFDLNVAVQEAFFEAIPPTAGGTFSNFAQWIPGRIVSESIDPFHMTSVEDFETWGREPVERILNHFDGGVIHIHGNGRHLLESAATIRGLVALLLLDDRGYPLAFDIVNELKQKVGDLPISLFAPYEAFAERLERRDLPGGVFYQVQGVPDLATAERLMEKVRAYRV